MICKLGTLASVKGGKRLPKGINLISAPNSHPYIRVRDLNNQRTLELNSNYEFVDNETQKQIARYIVQKGDIILSIVGTIGLVAIVGESLDKANLTENCVKIVVSEKIDSKFLYYYLKSPIGQAEITKRTVGAVQAKLPIKNIQDIDVWLPHKDIQAKIASVLSCIDDKIELNNKINENLERQAQAIYQEWFVDLEPFGTEMPSDWFVGTVDDLAKEVVCGKTPSTKKTEYYGSDIPFVTIPDMHGNIYTVTTERYLSVLGANSQAKKSLPKNTVCVSCIGTAGLVTLVAEESQTNQQINSIIPKDGFSPYYIYFLMKSHSNTINKFGQSGSTIVNLNKSQFGKIQVTIPSLSTMTKFDEIVSPIFEKILQTQKENLNLSSLRDTILPKLMSGEIDIEDVNI